MLSLKASRNDVRSLSRLENQAAFDRLRKSSQRWVSPSMVLQILPHDAPHTASYKGLLISVSKKTAPRSVDRSRLRRRLRAVSAEILPHHACSGYDFALIARNDTLKKTHEELKKDLLWCLKRLNIKEKSS